MFSKICLVCSTVQWQLQLELNGNFYWHATSWPVNAARRYNISACLSTKLSKQPKKSFHTFVNIFRFSFLSLSLFTIVGLLVPVARAGCPSPNQLRQGKREECGNDASFSSTASFRSRCRCRRCHDENIIKVYDSYLLQTMTDTCECLSFYILLFVFLSRSLVLSFSVFLCW